MMEFLVFDFNVFGTDGKRTTLDDILRYCGSFMFQNIEKIIPSAAIDIVKGLKYLYSNEVVHRDLKPANVLIYRNSGTTEEHNKVFQDKSIICKFCDFDQSRYMLRQTKSIACTRTTRETLAQMAPELLPGDQQSVTSIGKSL